MLFSVNQGTVSLPIQLEGLDSTIMMMGRLSLLKISISAMKRQIRFKRNHHRHRPNQRFQPRKWRASSIKDDRTRGKNFRDCNLDNLIN